MGHWGRRKGGGGEGWRIGKGEREGEREGGEKEN